MNSTKSEQILETTNLILRRYRITDFDDYWEFISNEKVGPLYGWEPYRTKKEAMARLNYEIRRSKQFAIVYKKEKKVVGSIELKSFRKENFPTIKAVRGAKEISYLLNEKYWGRNIMPEALQAVVELAFLRMDIPEILIRHAEANVHSAALQEKLGFKVMGRTENYRLWFGNQQTALIQRKMTKEEFLQNNYPRY